MNIDEIVEALKGFVGNIHVERDASTSDIYLALNIVVHRMVEVAADPSKI